MTKLIKEFEENTGHRVVYITLSGSKLYGTDSPTSDSDYKGIFIPSKRSVLLKTDKDVYSFDTNNTKEKNTKDDIDITFHSIYQFLNLLKKSETGSIDMLFSMFREDTIVLQDTNFIKLMKLTYEFIINKNMKSFVGYALGQTKKFGIKGARYDELRSLVEIIQGLIDNNVLVQYTKLKDIWCILDYHIERCGFKYIKTLMAPGPRSRNAQHPEIKYISVLGKMFSGDITIEYFISKINEQFNQFGNRTITISNTESKTDFKALSHSYRILHECKELITTNFIEFPLKYAEDIKQIKIGNCDVNTVINQIEETLNLIDLLIVSSNLPDEADQNIMDEIILSLM